MVRAIDINSSVLPGVAPPKNDANVVVATGSSDPSERNNFYNSQSLDVNDLDQEQLYTLNKIREALKFTAQDGIVELNGLVVSSDSIGAQPVSEETVEVSITSGSEQNVTRFPSAIESTLNRIQGYTVFQAATNNVQRVDLAIKLAQQITEENLLLRIEIKELTDSTNPLSSVSSAPALGEVQFREEDIPLPTSDEKLICDFSGENSGQGLSLLKDRYYAIIFEYTRPDGSTSEIDVFHSKIQDQDNYNSDLYSYFFVNGVFQQGLSDLQGIIQNRVIFHTVYTSAVKIDQGNAVIDGEILRIAENQFRFLELPDRRDYTNSGGFALNFVAVEYAELATDVEVIERTKNPQATRVQDSSNAKVFTEIEWEALLNDKEKAKKWLLLAVVFDTNIIPIFRKENVIIPQNSTNLSFHDWLNPLNTTPTPEALEIRNARPEDFIFFVSNVPAKVPLRDSDGNVKTEPNDVYDSEGILLRSEGDPVLDDVVRVLVNMSMDDGKNVRTFEMAINSEMGTGNSKFRNYAATISDLADDPNDQVFTFNFDTDEIAPNVFYNFIAFTGRGSSIFIQDYNRTVGELDNTGAVISVREQEFPVFLEEGDIVAVVNEDLLLNPIESVVAQDGATQYAVRKIENEVPKPIGVSPVVEVEFDRREEIAQENSFQFGDYSSSELGFTNYFTPIYKEDGVTVIENTDVAVTEAYDNGEITILVDNKDGLGPVDITFSGADPNSENQNRDRGGSGGTMLLRGELDPSISIPGVGYEVKVRNQYGKECTNLSSDYSPTGAASVSPSVREFEIIARGRDTNISPINTAGYEVGDDIFVYVGDKIALDDNDQPIRVPFVDNTDPGNDPSQNLTNLPEIKKLGDAQYFREKTILSTEQGTVAAPGFSLIDPAVNGERPGQVIFNAAEIPSAINSDAEIFIVYNATSAQYPSNVDYFLTNYNPYGTASGLPISNVNVIDPTTQYISVPDAVSQGYITIQVDGVDVTDTLSPIGQKKIVADDGAVLKTGEMSINPEEGKITFYRNITTEVDEGPTANQRLTITYYDLDLQFIFNENINAPLYDAKYDLNNDGRIEEQDLAIMTTALGSSVGDINYLAAADFNNDGKIDNDDFEEFQNHFGAVASGTPDYANASTARLGALLVTQDKNTLIRLEVVKAVSKPADESAPLGRTILFFNSETLVPNSGDYTVKFGFAAALYLGRTSMQVPTERSLGGLFNFEAIDIYKEDDPETTLTVTAVDAATEPDLTGRFMNTLYFSPAISSSSENGDIYVIRSNWVERDIAIRDTRNLVVPLDYEANDRKINGPFKINYNNARFERDGTSIAFNLNASDATFVDGTPDESGSHIQGVPISDIRFTVHLVVPNDDGETSTRWTWNGLRGTPEGLKIEFNNEHLAIDDRTKGLNGKLVLTPFGLGGNQVSLMPKFAGGSLENNLSNFEVIRDDTVPATVKVHNHTSEREGGILTSEIIEFKDKDVRFSQEGNVTDTIYELLDKIRELDNEIAILKVLEGVTRWDSGLFWDDPDIAWDQP